MLERTEEVVAVAEAQPEVTQDVTTDEPVQSEADDKLPSEQRDTSATVENVIAALDEAHPVEKATEDAPEKAGEQEKPEAGDAPAELDARLKHAAERAGLAEDDIANMGDKAVGVLGKLADGQAEVDTRLAEIGRAKQPEGETPADGEDEKFDIQKPFVRLENPKDEDGDVVWGEEFMAYANSRDQAIEGLRSTTLSNQEKVNVLYEAHEAREQREYVQKVDGFFDSLGKGYEKLYGKGPGADMDAEGDTMKTRRAVVEQASALQAGLEATGKDYDTADLLERAHFMVNHEYVQDLARKTALKSLSKRAKQITVRPGAAKPSMRTQTRQDRIDALGNDFRELGMDG